MLKGEWAAKLTDVGVNLFDKIDLQGLILKRAKNPAAFSPLVLPGTQQGTGAI